MISFILFLIHTIRNYTIIKDLQNKGFKYKEATNYYIKLVANENNGTILTTKYYKKENREVIFLERNLDGVITKISMYNNGNRTDTFIEAENTRIAQLDSEGFMNINIYNCLETDNNLQTIINSMCSTIKSVKYNGKECYIVTGAMSVGTLNSKESKIYIEKESGLLIKSIDNKIVTDKEYDFNNIDNSVFTEPDIGKYTLK